MRGVGCSTVTCGMGGGDWEVTYSLKMTWDFAVVTLQSLKYEYSVTVRHDKF